MRRRTTRFASRSRCQRRVVGSIRGVDCIQADARSEQADGRGRVRPRTGCRCCGSRSTSPIRCSASASSRCSRLRTRSAARCSATLAIGRAPTGRRPTSAPTIQRQYANALGLSRPALEHAAYAHLDAAPHLRRFVTKALAMHLADSVWSATERHLFRRRDRQATRHARRRPLVRLRAAAGTRALAYQGAQVGDVSPARHARRSSRRVHRSDGGFFQPRTMRPIAEPAIVVVATTGRSRSCSPACPAARSSCRCGCRPRRPISPSSITTSPIRRAGTRSIVVRRRDPNAIGGWRYEAHLMVLTAPYVVAARGGDASGDRAAHREPQRRASTSTSPTSRSRRTRAGTTCA